MKRFKLKFELNLNFYINEINIHYSKNANYKLKIKCQNFEIQLMILIYQIIEEIMRMHLILIPNNVKKRNFFFTLKGFVIFVVDISITIESSFEYLM